MAIDTTQGGEGQPATHAALVSPNDGVDLEYTSRALYVGGAGAVAVTMLGGDAVTFSGVLAGTILPIRVTRVKSTGTTATLILALR
jgi:hypothetical protein